MISSLSKDLNISSLLSYSGEDQRNAGSRALLCVILALDARMTRVGDNPRVKRPSYRARGQALGQGPEEDENLFCYSPQVLARESVAMMNLTPTSSSPTTASHRSILHPAFWLYLILNLDYLQ